MTKIDDIDEIVRQTVAKSIRTGELLQINREAGRIAAETGLPRRVLARELFDAGIAARIDMEFGERPEAALQGRSRPEGLGAELRSGGLEGIEFQYDTLGLAVELGGGHGAETVTGLEENDAGHQGGGEAECVFACKC